jgi:pimeloyl-ACP methyl ester carboxylesterase
MPVVLVHGTASSPGRWANMANDLMADPRVRDHFEMWVFFYATGSPVGYSALQLRETLTDAVERMDPAGQDRALRDMVVIGHSQGGLLAKMTVIDAGDRLWRALSSRPLEALRLSDESRDALRRAMFPTALPFVHRVVFMATPHRGSYVAARSLPRLLARFVRLPRELLATSAELLAGNADALRFDPEGIRLGAVHGMSPANPFLPALAAVPVAPGVAAHSIIAVRGDGPVAEGSDGVVTYASAHLDGVDSELVVRSGHSCQSNPAAIEELRRILLEHAGQACAAGIVACAGPVPAGATGGERGSDEWQASAPRAALPAARKMLRTMEATQEVTP